MTAAALPRRTEAAVLVDIGAPLRLMELELPPLAPGQVLVEVAYSGVCHSQVLETQGARGPDRFLPHTLGHEGAGTVLQVGPGVRKVRPGDSVVLSWIRGDGAEVPSTRYRSAAGPVNSGAISTFMRHTVTCENRVTPIAASVPLKPAALLGCAVLTGAGIVLNMARVTSGASVAVFGVGGIGGSALVAAVLNGAAPVIAVDVVDAKLEFARRMGASHTVNPRRDDAVKAIREWTGGRGVDLAVEAAGRRESMEAGFSSVREQGGLLVIAGNLPRGETIAIDPFDLIRGKRILGTWGGESRPDRDIPRFAALYQDRRLPLDELIDAVYPLAAVDQALADVAAGRVVRALIDMAARP